MIQREYWYCRVGILDPRSQWIRCPPRKRTRRAVIVSICTLETRCWRVSRRRGEKLVVPLRPYLPLARWDSLPSGVSCVVRPWGGKIYCQVSCFVAVPAFHVCWDLTHLPAGCFKKRVMSYLRLFHFLYLNLAENPKKGLEMKKWAVLVKKL